MNRGTTDTLKDEFKFNIISYLQTGNVLIDTFIRVFLFTLITSITSYFMNMGDSFHSIKKKLTLSNIHNFFYKPKVITITGSRYLSFQYLSTKLNFSLRFRAVLDKIIKSMIERNENNKLIQKIKELEVRENTSYYYDEEKHTKKPVIETVKYITNLGYTVNYIKNNKVEKIINDEVFLRERNFFFLKK